MKKIYILTAVFALLALSLNAQVQASKYGTEAPLKSPTEKVQAPNRADVLISGCSWDVNTDGTTLPAGWQATSRLSTNSDGSAYINSSSGGTITIPSSLLQGNSTVNVVINAASYNGSTYSLSVNNSSKSVYEESFSDYTWLNVNAANGITITMNSWNVSLISIKVYANSDPGIVAIPNNVTFKCAPNEIATQTVEVTGSNLTTGITATLNDPNNVFAINTNSLGANGGSLTVTYSPTAIGSHNGTITLTSGSATASITLNGSCVQELTVCDGSTTTGDLPIYGLWYDATTGQHNQMIYLANELTSLVNNDITSMTFYAPSGLKFSDGSVTFSIGETTTNEFSSATALTDNVTPVATVVPNGETEWLITFSTPYTYNGGNLLIQVDSQTGDYGTTNFTGMDVGSNRGFLSYNTTNSIKTTLPKVTFGYINNTNPKIEVSPQTLTISDSGTNNTFTVQGSNLGNDNVGLTQTNNDFTPTLSTTTGTYYDGGTYWGFTPDDGSVNGTIAMNYNGRELSASNTVTLGNNSGASATFTVNYVADLYIVTDNGVQGNWIFTDGTQMTNNDGIYTATFTADLANTYILFARKLGNDVNWGTRYVFGPNSGGDWWLPVDGNGNGTLDLYSDHPIKIQTAGSYIVTINANDGTFTITKMVPDLAIALSAPESVVGGNDATVTATVTNTGEAPVTSYTVTITADGNTISTQTVNETLAIGASATFTADYETTAAQVGSTVSFAANVACTGDADATNNNATASTEIINVPAPVNVVATGDSDNQSATVTWDAPSNSSAFPLAPTTLIWDFEEESDLDDFTTIDSDGDGYNWKWYTNVGASSTLVTHDGSNGVIYSESYFKSTQTILYPDNWLISPEINLGGSVSFWACGQDANQYWNEVFAVYVCVGSYNNVSDFIKISPDVTTTHDMTQYTYDLSQYQGKGYFAIRHYNVYDQFYLNVDDITCETFAPTPPVSYNIYLDGVLVGSVNANDPLTYDFSNVSGGEHTASVSAVYSGNIESALVSDTFTLLAKTPTPTITYEVTNGTVVITATGEGTVTLEVDGQTVTSETGTATATIVRSIEDRTVTATATAQQDGALESYPASQPVTIPALNTTPTNPESGLLRLHLLIVDQMKEEIPADNSHPDAYGYVLRYEPNGPNGAGMKESGSVKVEIQKADCEVMGAYTLAEVDNDKNIGAYDPETNTINHNLGMKMNAITADVEYDLSDDNDILYAYLLQGAENRLPGYQADYLTELQKTQNFTYVEMEETNPNKGDEYPNGEHHYFIGTDNLLTGAYGSSFVSYAPSVSTWGISRRYYEDDGYDNTYGAPIWKTGAGYVEMRGVPTAELQTGASGSTNWEYEGQACSLYILDNIQADGKLPKSTIATVQYEPYMFRVFVESKNGLLRNFQKVDGDGVTTGDHYEGIAGDTHGPICIWSGYIADAENDTYGQTFGQHEEGGETVYTFRKEKVERSEPDGEWDQDETNAIFAAVDALAISGYDQNGNPIYNNITEDDLNVFVRFYYVIKGSADEHEVHSGRAAGDSSRPGNGSESPGKSPSPWTAVSEVSYDGEVVSRTYVNSLGMQSDEPFDGVNIVITRYSDGKVSTTKVIR